MAIKRYITANDLATASSAKWYTGSSWTTCTVAKRYNGSQWINLLDGAVSGVSKTYNLASAQVYWNGGSKDNQSSTLTSLIHGTYGTSGKIRRTLLWFDPQMFADIQGANISKIEIYLHRESSSHGNSGASNVWIRAHNYTSAPSNYNGGGLTSLISGSRTLKRGAGDWFDITSGFKNGLLGGSLKGIALDSGSSTSMSNYVRYNRTGTYAPKIKITFA